MSRALLTVKKLSFGYADSPLCEALNFVLAEGQWYAVKGRNGIGKTSLLRALCGLIQPLDGEVTSPTGALPAQRVLPEVIYVGHSSGLKPELTVYENLSFYSRLEGKKPNDQRIEASARKLQIDSILGKLCADISQGQLRRTSLCRLTLTERKIWLLDEPAAALDSVGIECFGKLVAEHLAQGGCALIATHSDLTIPNHPVADTFELSAYA